MEQQLQGIDVLVLGLGESGLAMARWCARCGAGVRVWDSRETPPNEAALAEFVPAARLLRGALDAEAFAGVSLVLKSPGLASHDARIAGPLRQAVAAGVAVQGELDLFARALIDLKQQRGYDPKTIAITGTNGKTTTTAMTALLVGRTGRRVAAAGNIGPTLLQTLADGLEGMLPDVWVLELSSFQLDAVSAFEPSAAAVLNLSEDHLDWHGSMADYGAAKARIFGQRAVMVVNRDDAAVERLVPVRAQAKPARAPRPTERRVLRFGLGAPTRPGDFGLVAEHGIVWLVRAHSADADDAVPRGPRRGALAAAVSDDEPLRMQRLMPTDALRVRGRHNAANALAALALATAIGCPLAPLLHALRDYAGEPHRVEHVGLAGGVDAFDDSKGTNVGATVAALDGLGRDRAPARLVVILGGDGKGQDFAPLAEPVRRHARAVATIGRDAPRIEAALAATGVPLQRHDSLQAATRWSFGQARRGDAVLLSPACASLDMFRDYRHRAEVFVAEVRALAAEDRGLAA